MKMMIQFHQPTSMASLCSLLFLAILISATNAQIGLILPIRKDPKTSQLYTTFQMGSGRATITPVIDLGGPHLWISCDNYTSNSYAPIPCDTPKCELAGSGGCVSCTRNPPRPGCTVDTCGGYPSSNPYMDYITSSGYYEDTLSSKDHVQVPQYMFSCVQNDYLSGLAAGATGMLGLGMNPISIHKQVANKLNLADKFSICPPSSGLGKLSIGSFLSANSDTAVKSTRLIINPGSTAMNFSYPSEEYFIDVKSITVAGKKLSVKDAYFSFDKNGVGGTKISTVQNYTSLHTSIYKPLARAFDKAAANMKIRSAAAVAPFTDCYRSDTVSRAAEGPGVPAIDLVLPGKDVYWRINGANSMVEVDRKTMCLGFVDAGSRPTTSIVIGVHQLLENLLEFDLGSMQLRFSSSLLGHNKTCSHI